MNYRVTHTTKIGGLTETVTFECNDRWTVEDQLDRWLMREPRNSEAPKPAEVRVGQ